MNSRRELIHELKRRAGGTRQLALKLEVTEKSIQDWSRRSDEELSRLHPTNVEAILKYADECGLDPERFEPGPSLWDLGRSYEDNLKWESPSHPRRPRRPFLNHAIDFLGFRINSPVGAGPCDMTATPSRIKFLLGRGADVISPKNGRLFETPAIQPLVTWFCAGNQQMLEAPLSETPEVEVIQSTEPSEARHGLVASMRGHQPVPSVWQARFRESDQSKGPGQLVILPVNAVGGSDVSEQDYIANWVRVVEMGVDAGASIIQLDFSMPFETSAGYQLEPFRQPALASKICKAVQTVTPNTKIILKIGYLVGESLRRLVLETAGLGLCHGFAAINSPIVRAFHRCSGGHKIPLGASMPLFLSGRPILGLGLHCVSQLRAICDQSNLGSIGIIGTGGVTTNQDFLAYLNSGANVVMVASALYFDSYFPFKLRRFYDDQAQQSERVVGDETDLALATFAKAAWMLQTEVVADAATEEKIMGASQVEMVDWLRRKGDTTSLGPLLPRRAPSLDECYRLVRNRVVTGKGSLNS